MAPTDLHSFEADYFKGIYRRAYDQRNPRYKHQSYLREVRRLVPTGRLLDVGCAYGAFLREAVSRFDCNGCDISVHAVEVAEGRVPAARVFQSDVLKIPGSREYDVVTCFDVLEHVPEVHRALAHLRGLLRPGGVLVASMPVYDTVVGKLVERLDRDPTHVHKVARYRWLEWLEAAGFTRIAWKGILRYYFGGPAYLHWCHPSIRRFSPAILVSAAAPEE